MESEWALNSVRLGWADPPRLWTSAGTRPSLCGRVFSDTLIYNDYEWVGGRTIYREIEMPVGGQDTYDVGPTRFAAGFLHFPFGRELLPEAPL